ncbi:hypothetical protein [Peteryoungia ipomoeae]|uniref:Uncharacterized protein n=1 Tax=Peteryoungia ipomoeae TaxID=1210932 RepID=A0A4S8P4B5_9HYPH|nr:hypothetical protein [Peteryoungia ipomoeae]THV24897.1 hypothetical protein FAA97_01405 [Peteryoungia ipomoeae]
MRKGVDRQTVADALTRVLTSRTFARSERLRAFLKFVVEMEQVGLGHQLKGYTIGIDVFSRGEGFDPGTDPLVRVQAGKLRKLLNQFYADEGIDEPLRIRIPLGGYVPVYEEASSHTTHAARGTESHLRAEGVGWSAQIDHLASSDLPRIAIIDRSTGDRKAAIFMHSLLGERNTPVIMEPPLSGRSRLSDTRPDATLHFEIYLDVFDRDPDCLDISIVHPATGSTLSRSQLRQDEADDAMDIALAAHQFAAAALTIPGLVYRFSRKRKIASPLMRCLEATYRYQIEQTEEALSQARDHQNMWSSMRTSHGVITEIPRLIALAYLAN